MLRAIFPDRPDEAERRTKFRMARQALVTQPDPPLFWAVLDEAVLCRRVGGRDVLRRQLEHLRSMASRPNITVQVLPFESGEHAAMDGGFAIVGFPESVDPDIVYLEHTTGDLYIEEAQAVARYSLLFERLLKRSLSEVASKRLLAKLAKEL